MDVDERKSQLWSYAAGCNLGDITPCAKGIFARRTILIGAEVVAAKLEVVVDPAVGGKKALRMTC